MSLANFDRIAPFYPLLEYVVFGNSLSRARETFLPAALTARHVLLLGEGNGRFLTRLFHAGFQGKATCLEPSAGMIRHAQARMRRVLGHVPAQVRFISRPMESWTPEPAAYDAISAHFFFDLFTQASVTMTIEKLTQAATADAVLGVAEFRMPASAPAQWRARFWLSTMYRGFRMVSGLTTRELPPWESILEARGWTLHARKLTQWDFLGSDLWRRQPGR